MEPSNPEVKLALAAERGLRRPAAQLRALLAAARREALAETPLEEMLAGPDLTVLAGLLEALPADVVPARTARRGRGLTMNPAVGARAGRVQPANRPVRESGEIRAPRVPGEIGRPRFPTGPGEEAPRPAPILPLPCAAKDAARPGIADRRAALRRAIAALPSTPASAAPPLLRTGAAPPGQDLRDSPPSHALIAQAARAVTVAAAAARAERAVAEEAGLHAPARAAPDAASPADSQRPGDAVDPPARSEAERALAPLSLLSGDAARAGIAPRVADHAPPVPRPRSAAPLALDDDADALTEAAWRNGVDST